MNVDCAYIRQLAAAETVFDMAAICYRILEDEVANPIVFISTYVDESEPGYLGNPNFETLIGFSDFISEKLEKYSELNFAENRNEIIRAMQEIELIPFLKEKENQLSVIFTLLSTIDSLVPFWDDAVIMERNSLNRGKSKETHFVYLSCRKYIHKVLIQEIGRARKSSGDIGETLNNLLFLKKDVLPKGAMAPEICFLHRRSREYSACTKVAIIVGMQGIHFTTEKIGGSTEVIRYKNELQIKTAENVWQKIHTAIRCGAEFILLPEFCVSEDMLEYFEQKLSEYMLQENAVSKLIAVFSGSTWIQSNDNVQFILDAWGRKIGTYYKNTPFRKEKRNKNGYQRCEGLQHPGYRTSLFRIEELGYLLPATCRDVIDGKYTEYLIQKFLPTFLFIPAWSSSGSSFERPLKGFAADYFVNSVLCNGCGALIRKTSIMGGVVIPYKKQTVAAGYFKKVKKIKSMTEKCQEDCEELCSYILEIDFSNGIVSPGGRISCRKY